MSKLFLTDSYLAGMERLMMAVPHVRGYPLEEPKRNRTKEKRRQDAFYQKTCQLQNVAFRHSERMADSGGDWEQRGEESSNMLFMNQSHKERFCLARDKAVQQGGLLQLSNELAAALFLLSADEYLWDCSREHIRQGKIAFQSICVVGVSMEGYALFHTAKDICCGTSHTQIADLFDLEVISDRLLCLLLAAVIIRRYGVPVGEEEIRH